MVEIAIEIQSAYSPWLFDQNSDEPQWAQNWRITAAEEE